jgi:hypothetical protein
MTYVPPTIFTLQPEASSASNGTEKLCFLLQSEDSNWLGLLTPEKLEKVFGKREVDYIDRSRGYEDPEWYWQDDIGAVWGIGFRWRTPRLRGNWDNSDAAQLFINHLKQEMGVA